RRPYPPAHPQTGKSLISIRIIMSQTLRARSTPVSFELYAPPQSGRAASGSDVFDLVLLGDLKHEVLPSTRPDQQFSYSLWRDDADSLVADIDDSHSAGRYLIHSDLGNGKTIAAESLKYALHVRGFTVLTLKPVRDIISIDIPYLTSLPGRTVIFVDDVFKTNNRSDLISLVNQFSHFSYIGTCRTSVFDLQGHELNLIFGDRYVDYDANVLSDRECQQIVTWFDTNGLWGVEAGLTSGEKLGILTNKCRREFRSIILDRFNSSFMRQKIDTVFRSIQPGRVKDWLLHVLIVELCGFEPNARFVQSLAGYSPSRQELAAAGPVKEFIGAEGGYISVRSPVLAELLSREMFDRDEKVRALVSIAKAAGNLTTGRDIYSELIKFTYRPAIMGSIFSQKDYLPAAKALFDELKSIDGLQNKSLFWLQYAIILTSEREYFGAKVIFDTAFGRARNSDFDTFQVDNHYARFLLESRMSAPKDFPDAFFAFLEAHKRIRNQILRDRSATHPYRVAELYPDFLKMRHSEMDPGQRAVVRKMTSEMIELLAKAKIRNRHQKIRETKAALEEFLENSP
uniref:hypothetical protein n=1 Tax=Brevundimonas sp. TWP2-3-2 TaxID=2804648 RepID=UPI003CF3EDAE